MAFDIVALGLACADVMVRPVDSLPERGKVQVVPILEMNLGGLSGVAASVFCRLGGQATFIGSVGTDPFGDFVINTLRTDGVQTDGIRRVPDHGTASTVVLVGADGERTFLHHAGASATLCEQDIDFGLIKQARLLHWGGPAVTPGLDGRPIGRILAKAHELGLRTSMDTCYDGAGLWMQRIEHALPHLDIVMTSIDEARQYTQCQDPEDIADAFRSFGVETVMVKLGSAGLLVKNSKEACRLAAHRVTCVDTTGAGDAACAGFLYGYVKGWNLTRCSRLANTVGALTVQVMGGAKGVTSLADTLAFMEKE